jgi:hypothetical protein
MLSLLAYSKFIALNTGNAGSIQWEPDQSIMYLHGRPIVIERFQQMVRKVITEAETLLWERLM